MYVNDFRYTLLYPISIILCAILFIMEMNAIQNRKDEEGSPERGYYLSLFLSSRVDLCLSREFYFLTLLLLNLWNSLGIVIQLLPRINMLPDEIESTFYVTANSAHCFPTFEFLTLIKPLKWADTKAGFGVLLFLPSFC